MRRATISNTFTVNTVEDGESPIFADLDNEMFGVACEADGRSSAVVDKTINVSMWYGLTRLTLSEITYAAPEGVSVTATAGVGTVRIVIPQGTLLQETNTVSLVLKASYDGTEYTRNLSVTISAVRGGSDAEIFEWMPNVGNVLKKDDGTYSISSVICTVQRIKGDSVSDVTNPSLYGLTAVYSIDGGSEQAYTIGSGIATSSFTRSVRFSLYKGNTLVDRETILMVYDGSSGYVLDLDNENDSILYDGNTIIGSKPQTTWTLYKGGVDISDSVVKNANTIHITAEECTANFVSGSVYRTVQVDSMTAETGKVTISVTHGGNTYSAVMSVKKLVGVDKYEIVVAPNAITYNETDPSKSSSTWINIKVYRTSGATGNRMFVSRLADESLTLFISPILQNGESAGHTRIADGSSQGSYTSNDGASRSLSTNYPQFKVDLFKGGTESYGTGVSQDSETIPVIKVEDGEDGTPAPEKSETRYAWSTSDRTTSPTTEPVLDNGTTWLTYITNRPSTGTYYLWQRIKRWTWNATTKEYVLQSTMYFRMSGEDAKATQIKGLVRKVWEHSNVYDWPPDPKSGDKVLILNNPSLYVYNGTSWSMSITASVGDAYVFSEDSHVYVCISTTASLCWQDVGTIKGADGASSYIHIAWANSGAPDYEGFTTSKNPEDVYKYIGVCSGTGEEPDPEDPTLYTWSEIKGYDASTWIVMLNSATVKVSASGIMTGNIAGSFYKETNGQRELVTNYSTGSSVYVVIEAINANGVQKTWRYSATYGTFSTGGWGSQWLNNKSWSTYGSCQELRVSCEVGGEIKASLHLPVIQDGQQGERGKTGRNYYFRGTWEDFIEEEEPTFQVTDSEAPFFSRTRTEENKEVTRYWVFTGDNGTYTPQSPVCPPSDNGSWTLMVTDFKFLIGEAIFYDFAKLGSAIFNKDWMFSQYGYTGTARGNDYPAFSPQFPNKDVQTLDLDTTTITSTALLLTERDKICPLVMKAGVSYWFSIEATGYSSNYRLYIALMNQNGEAETFEGGSTYVQFTTNTTITGSVTPTVSGTHYWVGAVSNANYAGSVQAILMQCDAPFIPTVAVDWLRGYAHFSNDKVRFNEEGDGYVAGGNISWDAQGNASFAGNVEAESGNIGDFVLDNGDLRVGANVIWDEDTQSGNYTLLSKGRMRMKSILTNVVSIKLAMGNNANQGDSRALVISRTRMDNSADYIPAVELATNTSTLESRNNQIALRTTGLNVAKSGIASFGHIHVFNSSSSTLDLSKGCEWLLVPNSTSQRTLYLPTPYDINSLLYGESDAQFALKIMLVSHYSSSMGNILVRFQDSSALGFINHDGRVWHGATEGVTLTRGRMIELMLVYYAGSYYAQRLSDTL